ncbi:hypothetical protein JCM8097_002600 [Rhodosporidiobolus ruineniae]
MQALRTPTARLAARRVPSAAPSSAHFAFTARSYATAQNATEELQAKQMKLAEKAGRMKHNMGAIVQVPVFANHVPPAGGRVLPADATISTRWGYLKHDVFHAGHSMWTRWGWRKLLGTKWFEQFKDRSLLAYREMNQALVSGNYEALRNYASLPVIDSIKSQRTRKLQGLRMSWKLHKVVAQDVVCARQQEVFKKDEHIGQMVVRFVTEQSLEVRDTKGRLVGSGSHDRPERVTEYCIFQRDMWRGDDDWKCVKKGARETDTLADPTAQP